MTTSYVREHNGVPTLFVNGKPFPACAYMTYLEERNRYSQFAEAGYKLFSVPVLFEGKWISKAEWYKPFHGGIFDVKNAPDFSSVEHSFSLVLEACPDALIFPRINMSMPDWWLEENPHCLDSLGNKECLCSEKWKNDAGILLNIFLEWLEYSKYRDNIVGLQIAGGNTEEWFHFDHFGGCCENSMPGFRKFLKANYPECEYNGIPDLSILDDDSFYLHKSSYVAHYLEYSNKSVADAIVYFASIAKKVTDRKLAVGTFYGYTLEVASPFLGSQALETVLNCDDVDFICSPNSYIGIRDKDTEWTEMYPADSVRLHGKLCMQECDIRTHLTKLLSESSPETDPQKKMTAPIWHGLSCKEDSLKMIEKSFLRQLKKGNGFWWFDMWGGWYDDPDIMQKMKEFREIYSESLNEPVRKKKAEVAVIVDEEAFRYMTDCDFRRVTYNQRKALGEVFSDYDTYDVFDFDRIKDKYSLFIFTAGQITERGAAAVKYCMEYNINYLCASPEREELSCEELKQAFLQK